MLWFFFTVWTLLIVQRLAELTVARRNAIHLRSRGAVEVGAEHYKYLVGLHAAFLVSLPLEVVWADRPLSPWWWLPFSLFLLAQAVRYWAIRSLGPYWNTRILVIPGAPPVKRGPYRWLKHPNYLVVAAEILTLPLTFSAFFTAVVFSLANLALLLFVRIPSEERAVYGWPKQTDRPPRP